jgi:outer membrane protein
MNRAIKKQLNRILWLCLVAAMPLQAAQDLVGIYGLALKEDAELRIAEAEYLSAIENVPLARSGARPQIFFNADGSVEESDIDGFGDASRNNLGYSLDLTQSLYNTDTRTSINAAEARSAAALADLRAVREGLILRTADAYFQVLAAHDGVDFAYAEREAIARQLEQAQKRFEVGLIAITDVHEAQARFDTAEASVITSENLLENSYQALAVITGDATIRDLARLGEDLSLTLPEPANAEAWVGHAIINNRALIAAKENLRAARFERDGAEKNRNPTLDLSASFGGTDSTDDFRGDVESTDVFLGLQLQIPLYAGGSISAERQQADANYVAAQNSVLLQNRLAAQDASTAYLDVVSGISQVKAFKQALDSTLTALEATQAGYDVGTRTSVDVLISLQETFRAKRDHARSRYDYLLSTLRLRQAAGLLGEDHLFQINRWLVQP